MGVLLQLDAGFCHFTKQDDGFAALFLCVISPLLISHFCPLLWHDSFCLFVSTFLFFLSPAIHRMETNRDICCISVGVGKKHGSLKIIIIYFCSSCLHETVSCNEVPDSSKFIQIHPNSQVCKRKNPKIIPNLRMFRVFFGAKVAPWFRRTLVDLRRTTSW